MYVLWTQCQAVRMHKTVLETWLDMRTTCPTQVHPGQRAASSHCSQTAFHARAKRMRPHGPMTLAPHRGARITLQPRHPCNSKNPLPCTMHISLTARTHGMLACVCVRARGHAHMRVCVRVHPFVSVIMQARGRALSHTHNCVRAHTHTHKHTHAHGRAHVCARTHACVCARVCARARA